MKKIHLSALLATGALAAGLLAPTAAQAAPATANPGDWPGLAQRLAPVVADAKADGVDLGLFVSDLSGGTFDDRTLYLGKQDSFTTASTIKLALAATVMHQVEAGQLALTDPATIAELEVVGGSGVLQNRPRPIATTVGEMLTLMIQVSDNTATNKLVDVVGGFNPINTLTESAGIAKSDLHFGRKMFGATVLPDGDLWSTPHGFKQLLDLYYDTSQGTITPGFLGRPSATSLIALMRGQTVKTKLGATIPGNILAHKTGENATVSHDLGFLLLSGREVSIGVFTSNTGGYPGDAWYAAADPYVQQVGAIVYDYVLRETGDGSPAPLPTPAATKTTISLNRSTVAYGKGGVRVTVRVSAATTPSGRVAVYSGTKLIKRGTLKKGRVRISLPRKLARGKHRIKVSYRPSGTKFAASTSGAEVLRVR
ncbi:serine hydrolase [Nocardioides sp. W7]|uniref:serine hydrolase n=1 Tax=Nocardioides sp. W7 TaxID=2931390 RepID=UPI001FD5AA19|nr:serine hydrolase [Nocardioides sp. W7]